MAISIPGLDFSPPAGDESLQLLGKIFGGVTSALPGDSTVMAALMNVFNGAILSLASIFAFYTIVSAVVQTAHDGEVLGKRYSSLWVPIRSAAGIAAIVPAGGFSAVQVLVLFITVQGVGLADRLYSAGFEAAVSQGGFAPPVIASTDGERLSRDIIPTAACITANKAVIARAGMADAPRPVVETVRTAAGAVIVNAGLRGSSGLYRCGSFIIQPVKSKAAIAAQTGEQIQNAQVAAATTLLADIQQLTDAVDNAGAAGAGQYSAYIEQAGKKYDQAIDNAVRGIATSAANAAKQQHQQALNALKSRGWSALGESYSELARLSADVSQAVKAGEVSTNTVPGTTYYVDAGEVESRSSHIRNLLADATEPGSEGKSDDSSGLWGKLVKKVSSLTIGAIDSFVSAKDTNVLLEMKARGDVMLNLAGAIMAGGFGVSALGGVATLGAANGAISGMMAFISMLAFGLMGLGLSLSVYLPMLPYIIWFAVLLAWMVAVAEAVMASPLWMMMHLSADGDGFSTPATEAGYKFLAAIFLRPALSVISFFIAALITLAMGWFLNETFINMVKSIQTDTLTGLFSYIGFCGVYAALCISLINRAFGLTLTIPEAILRWIGTSLTGSEGLERDSNHHFSAIGGVAQQAARDTTHKAAAKGLANIGGPGASTPGATPGRVGPANASRPKAD